jgi:hypothetical protein
MRRVMARQGKKLHQGNTKRLTNRTLDAKHIRQFRTTNTGSCLDENYTGPPRLADPDATGIHYTGDHSQYETNKN